MNQSISDLLTGRTLVLFLILLAVGGFLFFANGAGKSANPEAGIVAMVDGKPITLNESLRPPRSLELEYRFETGRDPSAPQSRKDIEARNFQRILNSLAARITMIIRAEVIEKFHITITDDEMRQSWKLQWKQMDGDKAFKIQHEFDLTLWKAVRMVREEHRDKDVVYQQVLAKFIPKIIWELQLDRFKAPEQRERFQQKLKLRVEDWRNDYHAAYYRLEEDKVNARIDQELEASDPEVADYQALSKLPGGRAKADEKYWRREYSASFMDVKRYLWWLQQYRRANIRILDKKYAGVMRLIFPKQTVAAGSKPR